MQCDKMVTASNGVTQGRVTIASYAIVLYIEDKKGRGARLFHTWINFEVGVLRNASSAC
jgi:hypothetical protein